MPYRYAHHLIALVLVPIVMIAFWPHYFGDLRNAPFAFHAHGLTATAWILLVAGQSWSVHNRRFSVHRAFGRAVFGLVPLFAGGAALALHGMAVKYVTRSDPFYTALGPMLGLDDVVSTTALVLLVRAALLHRRRAAVHGGYMLATVMLVFPPILSRLNLPTPFWLHPGEVIAAIIAAVLYARAPKQGTPFLVLIGVLAGRIAIDTLAGFAPWWVAIFAGLSTVWPPLLVAPATALAVAALWSEWRPLRWAPSATPATAPGS